MLAGLLLLEVIETESFEDIETESFEDKTPQYSTYLITCREHAGYVIQRKSQELR
jgi:hypothetical protein